MMLGGVEVVATSARKKDEHAICGVSQRTARSDAIAQPSKRKVRPQAADSTSKIGEERHWRMPGGGIEWRDLEGN